MIDGTKKVLLNNKESIDRDTQTYTVATQSTLALSTVGEKIIQFHVGRITLEADGRYRW